MISLSLVVFDLFVCTGWFGSVAVVEPDGFYSLLIFSFFFSSLYSTLYSTFTLSFLSAKISQYHAS